MIGVGRAHGREQVKGRCARRPQQWRQRWWWQAHEVIDPLDNARLAVRRRVGAVRGQQGAVFALLTWARVSAAC